ncbi:MerC family mercury resistance protein [Marinobacter pelagius]|uniref:Arsenite methyltransferase n=1 Tax=Marinobacter pelagius TaxID=379482 RepID=A0A1I4XUD8_9GAMM|nr:MerC family mercury resistance protein [Marinobacter pelagius]SFN29508.1 MerC mercury resistance protein [Marinobacter pelagius]
MVAILGYSEDQIREAVQDMYTGVAEAPDSPYHFPVGAGACRSLGYTEEQIVELPDSTLASFAGVGWPFRGRALQPGDTTLDLGAGAGNDSVIASRVVGQSGHVIALDLTAAMTRKLRQHASGHCGNISVVQASAEQIPLAGQSVDSITSNGAINLVPSKRQAFREMFRVLKPGGRVQFADVVIRRPVNVDCDSDPRLWVECVVGATVEEDLLAMMGDTGFEDIQVLNRHDYFALSPSAQTREIARSFGAHSVEVSARRGEHPPGRLREWLRRSHPSRWLGQLHRRGFSGVAALGLALVSCYGVVAMTGLLTLAGIRLALSPQAWSLVIATFTLLAWLTIAAGFLQHRSTLPGLLATLGGAIVCFALFVDYHVLTELAGFALLAAGAFVDLRYRRRLEARKLGLDGATRGTSQDGVR